jgi:hypothetical protein
MTKQKLEAKAQKIIDNLHPPSVGSGYFARHFSSEAGANPSPDRLHKGMADAMRDFAYEVLDYFQGETS